MTTDIFLITYPGDYPWLPFLWRSIAKHVIGFRHCVVVLEDGDPEPPDLPTYARVSRCRRLRGVGCGGYTGQGLIKLAAHEHTDADVIWYTDSDTPFCASVDMATFKHPLLVTPWDQVGPAICWRDSARMALGFDPPFETMRRFPFVYPREFVREVYEHIGGQARLDSLFASGAIQNLSDFNVLGNYAVVKRPELFNIQQTDSDRPLPPRVVHQFWSRHTVEHPEVRLKLAELGLL